MFSSRLDPSGSGDLRALVPASVAVEPYNNVDLEDRGQEDEDVEFPQVPFWSYREIFTQRTKYMLTIVTIGILLLLSMLSGIIFLIVRASIAAPGVIPTTPPPIITTTTSVPTTTTTEHTSSTTISPRTTTTSPNTTTHKPGPAIPTVNPFPADPFDVAPTTLIIQVFTTPHVNYTLAKCVAEIPQTFKYTLQIKGVSDIFSGESNSKVHAKTAASKAAAEAIFGLDYGNRYPTPDAPQPCGDGEKWTSAISPPPIEKRDNATPNEL